MIYVRVFGSYRIGSSSREALAEAYRRDRLLIYPTGLAWLCDGLGSVFSRFLKVNT